MSTTCWRRWAKALALLAVVLAGANARAEFVDLPGGRFVMSNRQGKLDETPRTVEIAPSRLMTNGLADTHAHLVVEI